MQLNNRPFPENTHPRNDCRGYKKKTQALGDLVDFGRKYPELGLIPCLPLLASFCLEKEKKALENYKVGSNLSGKEAANYGKFFSVLKGKNLSSCMSAAKLAFIMVIIENYLIETTTQNEKGEVQKIYTWQTPGAITDDLKYTNHSGNKDNSGWSQSGLDRFYELQKREREHRQEMKEDYKDNPDSRPDNFKFFYGAGDHQSNYGRDGKEFAERARKESALGLVHFAFDSDDDNLMERNDESDSDLDGYNDEEEIRNLTEL